MSRGRTSAGLWRTRYGLAVLVLLLGGCAADSYMGISLKLGGADPALQALAVKAQQGDKQSQYELGRWFEQSKDPNGLKNAIKLYRIAATPRGGTRLLFVPGASGVTTSVVSTGQRVEPHKAAEERLRSISLDSASKIRSGRTNPANLYILPTYEKLPISEKLVIGRRRLVSGTLESLGVIIEEQSKVCAFLVPLYEKYFDSKVIFCQSRAYILNNSRVIYNLRISSDIQNNPPDGADDPYWIWLEGTTKASVTGAHCSQFYINSVGTRDHYYEILVGPAKAGNIDFEFVENEGKCNVRNAD